MNRSGVRFPKQRTKDIHFYKGYQRTSDYTSDSEDPVLRKLQGSRNVTYVQNELTRILYEDYNVSIPPQNYFSIIQTLHYHYTWLVKDRSVIQHQKTANDMRRMLDGFAWKPFKNDEIKKPKTLPNIDNLITEINDHAILDLVNRILSNINKRLFYERECSRSGTERALKKFTNKYNTPIRKKEIKKFLGDDFYGFKITPLSRQYMPRFVDVAKEKGRY